MEAAWQHRRKTISALQRGYRSVVRAPSGVHAGAVIESWQHHRKTIAALQRGRGGAVRGMFVPQPGAVAES